METVWIRDPEWKKFGSGIRDKHPGSATLVFSIIKEGSGSVQITTVPEPRDPKLMVLRIRIHNTDREYSYSYTNNRIVSFVDGSVCKTSFC